MDKLENLPPAELAHQLERLPEDEAREALARLPSAQSAAVLTEMDPTEAGKVLGDMKVTEIAPILQLLPPNLAADLIWEMPGERREEVLRGLPEEKGAEVVALLRYPPESAGGIMDNRFISVKMSLTVEQSLQHLRHLPPQRKKDILYIYVTDEEQKLVGVVSVRDLVFAPAERLVGDVMRRDIAFLRVTDDQEEIARQMQHSRFLGLPVVDERHQLQGVVRMRDALRIAQNEATEDMQLMVGLSGQERLWTPWKFSVAKRLPWLGINLCTSLLAASVVGLFEGTIQRWTALVVFLPLISAVAGNAGIQALTVIIRDLALGDVVTGDAVRAMRKELLIGTINGFALGMAIGLIGFGWKGSLPLGIVAGTAMLVNQVLGACSGVAIPFILRWMKIDPALASSILVTTLTDMLGFFVFLGLAKVVLTATGAGG